MSERRRKTSSTVNQLRTQTIRQHSNMECGRLKPLLMLLNALMIATCS